MTAAYHKDTFKKVLFKAPVLMVVQLMEAKEDATGAALLPPGTLIKLQEDATALLVDYLKVSSAFFALNEQPAKARARFQKAIATQLLNTHGELPLQRQDVSRIIGQLGCVTDWQQTII